MIIDITGIKLTPGNYGNDCLGNGKNIDKYGNIIKCCCDECDYMICCSIFHIDSDCVTCLESECPRKKTIKEDNSIL